MSYVQGPMKNMSFFLPSNTRKVCIYLLSRVFVHFPFSCHTFREVDICRIFTLLIFPVMLKFGNIWTHIRISSFTVLQSILHNCDMIKGNESDVADIVIEAIYVGKEIAQMILFSALITFLVTLLIDILFQWGLHQNVAFLSCH